MFVGFVVVLVAALGISGCGSTASGSSTTTKPPATVAPTTVGPPSAVEQLYDKTLAGVSHASSVHYVATSTGTSTDGTTHLRFVADVGVSDGSQVTTWSGADEKGSFSIILIGSATYLKGDADSLATFFGAIPALQASAYSGKWISFTPSDKLYSSLRGDLTVAAIATSLKFQPSADHRASGSIVVTGHPLATATAPAGEKASASMTISTATYLPEAQSFTASDKGATDASSIVFSDWNSTTIAPAPTGSITWASVAAAITPTTTTTPG